MLLMQPSNSFLSVDADVDQLIANHGDDMQAMAENIPDLMDLLPEEDKHHHHGKSLFNLLCHVQTVC